MTADSVTKGLGELVRPCSPTVVKHFVTLQAFKPFYEADPKKPDQARMDMVYEMLYDDVKDMPEVAVVLACDDLRTRPDIKWFPQDLVATEAQAHKDLIYDALDFFNQREN